MGKMSEMFRYGKYKIETKGFLVKRVELLNSKKDGVLVEKVKLSNKQILETIDNKINKHNCLRL
jgi:hypothetical protein